VSCCPICAIELLRTPMVTRSSQGRNALDELETGSQARVCSASQFMLWNSTVDANKIAILDLTNWDASPVIDLRRKRFA